MTIFSNIWNADHNFNDGNISISNTVNNLAVAYLETIVEGLTDSLASPILLGFLYQIDAYSKRSKPYPIVSQRQTVNLDLSACASFLFVPVSRLIDDYTLKLYVSSESGSSESIDLSAYALIEDLPDFASFVTNSVLTGLLSEALADVVTGSNLDVILTDYVLTVDLPTNSGSSSENYIVTAINTTLESGKKYYASVPDLIFSLPVSPIIGEVIKLSTGNHSLRINHGNASHRVLNSNTLTELGTGNGIILKPYADVALVFLGSDLWKTSYRVRTVNNWLDTFTESSASIKSYTATPLESYTYNASGNNVNLIHDGNKTNSGVMRSGGGTLGELRILLTFPYPTMLTSFNYWLGQFNGAFNIPTSVDVYKGSTVTPANLKGSIALSGTAGTRNITNTEFSTQYVFNFKLPNSGSISVLELEAIGTQIISGEVTAS